MAEQDDIYRKRVVYEVPGMEAVEVRRDLVYGQAEDGELRMDVYLPPGLKTDERRPAVILVHGGPIPPEAWPWVKDWGIFRSYGEILAASGLVAVTFNHRFLSLPDIGVSAANIAAALAFVRERAADFRLDPDRIGLWAFSGGGPHLAPFLREPPAWLRVLIGYYTLLDLQPMRDHGTPPLTDELVQGYSPAGCFPDGAPYQGPPILLARAGQDAPWLNATIGRFLAAALTANAAVDFFSHPQGRHGFDILDNDDRSREILERTLVFLEAHL
jgi:acetyl esterase/lipase